MANRRMFSLKVVDSDAFLDMGQGSQLLYFHLAMRADDDGFVGNHKKVMRMVGSSEDDMKVLLAKRFLLPFESGIVVIKHWKIHNYIQSDRYSQTLHTEEKSLITQSENGEYEQCIQNVSKLDTQVRLELGEVRRVKPTAVADGGQAKDPEEEKAIGEVIKAFEPLTPDAHLYYRRIPQREAARRLIRDPKIGLARVKTALKVLSRNRTDQFAPLVDSPLELSRKWAKVYRYVKPIVEAGINQD